MLSKQSVSEPRQHLSRAAITSLICGLVFIPIITGLAALVTGLLAIRATRDPIVLGRRWAVIGIILGVLNLIIWANIASSYIPTLPIRRAVYQYIEDVGNNRLEAALGESTRGRKAEVLADIAQIRDWGTVADVEVQSVNRQSEPGLTSATASGFIGITGRSIIYVYDINLINVDGNWKISHFQIRR